MARFAVGHTREVAVRHYADLPSLRPLHEAAVADAFRAAVAAAMPTVLPPTAEQALREAPEQVASLMSADTVGPVLDGEQDVWLAACAGFHSSPFAEPGSPCAQPFWGRSEEHTSELQSLMRISYAVFCLKKKKKIR